MQCYSAMAVSGMLTMHRLDLFFKNAVFGSLPELPIDVLAVDAQCVSTD
ncbi:hypothetical protein G4Y79_04425 [Phototrophicus methaneseepsis]|uniref:Uncharacterized protein n=1 Tax=Phototrophicus methaneseepsis TaxID=2710758 RepID=A0A7S8IGX2_9CHLR|nr:hypothetical protein G4Y79_20500 [Phototrophicus methaneseepsis]QPC85291.1 hypothetical protein G4Y79_20515 [Phototrophicus methaneseepsis]QPC85295.1 hypothetical protein G4Y79_04425 [Phototrophicus methaneseepsis]